MPQRAKVIFTDGFHVSATIETDNKDLRQRLFRVLFESPSPSLAATNFSLQTAGKKRPIRIVNTPEGRTYGHTIVIIEDQAFWPGAGDQAGIFLCHTDKRDVHFWGGNGFEDSPEFTKAIPQVEEFEYKDVD